MSKDRRKVVVDHEGNKFCSLSDMCHAYGISTDIYSKRKSSKWDLEKILATPVRECNKFTVDHLGQEFKNLGDMCKHWKMSESLVKNRLKHKWTIEEALTKPKKKRNSNAFHCVDHLGKSYNSKREMCEAYGIRDDLYTVRKSMGWSLEKILTTPVKTVEAINDSAGEHYNTKYDMYRSKGLNHYDMKYRINKGMSLEQATEIEKRKRCKECVDHEGNKFSSIKDMCAYWDVGYKKYYNRRKKGLSLKEALTMGKVNKRKLNNGD